LSLAFPLVNEHDAALKEKQDSEARWKHKNGFVKQKVENFNAHPKQPPMSVQDALKCPYFIDRRFTEEVTIKKEYRPS
jgi:hypothetical protein